MRAVTAGNAPADNPITLTLSERRGRALFFGKGHCSGCHSGPNFTDGRLWTTGSFRDDHHDDGAFNADSGEATSGRARFLGSFKTPSLREIDRTAPYFHDGHAADLAAVVAFYNAGGVRQDGQGHPLIDSAHDMVAEEINRKLGLTTCEAADLVAYLKALNGTEVNDGPVGLNVDPVTTIAWVATTSVGGNNFLNVAVKVQDLDDTQDIDTTMDWTLEVDIAGTVYHWSDANITPISRGYQANVIIPLPPVYLPIQARGADHHGRWSPWDPY